MRRQDNFLLTLWLALTTQLWQVSGQAAQCWRLPQATTHHSAPSLSALFVLVCLSRRLSIVREKTFATRNLLSCLAKVPLGHFSLLSMQIITKQAKRENKRRGSKGKLRKEEYSVFCCLSYLVFICFFLFGNCLYVQTIDPIATCLSCFPSFSLSRLCRMSPLLPGNHM